MSGEQNVLLEVRSLSKAFSSSGLVRRWTSSVQAVDRVSLTIREGETLGLVGESGCGKSTLGRCILRLTEATGGEILFKGQDITHLPARELRQKRREMQMIFQDPYACLNPRMTTYETIAAPLEVFREGTPEERRRRVEEIVGIVGMSRKDLAKYPHEFSGGQRQRIGIARAMILRPDLVVCDEPVSALDVSVRAQVLNLMSDLKDRFRLSYLFISHDLSVVRHISDRIAVMYLGQIVEIADKEALYRTPRHPYTIALMSAILSPDPDEIRDRQPLKGEMPSPYAPPAGCRFHTRCPYAAAECRRSRPELRAVGDGHFVACHRQAAGPSAPGAV